MQNSQNTTEFKGVVYSQDQVKEMHQWLFECFDHDEIRDLSHLEILKGIARHYEGGLSSFLIAIS